MYKHARGFTLVEIMISLLIVSFVIVSAFQVLSYVWIWKIRLIESSQIEKEAFFASERLIDLIKKWGTIDYEEYWNRNALWWWDYESLEFSSGSFLISSAFWNEGTMYYCLSWNWEDNRLSWNWCLSWIYTEWNRLPNSLISDNRAWQQRYWQYRLQYIDHNSDANDDFWDVSRSDWFANFIWDDDDLFLGQGPDTFALWQDVWELYLINSTGDERTFFRWRFDTDPYAPDIYDCDDDWTSKWFIWQWCLWTIQILKLQGRDEENDWFIDTWYIHPDFLPDTTDIPVTSLNSNDYWQSIFSNRIHVSRAEFYLYPNQNLDYAWADSRSDLQVAPYLQLRVTLMPSWRERRKLRWTVPEVNIATTIHLSQVDIF